MLTTDKIAGRGGRHR